LWEIVFPLSVAAAERCVFQQEATYGMFFENAVNAPEGEGSTASTAVQIRYVHAQLPAGMAGLAIGDRIVAINGDPLFSEQAETTMEYVRKLTHARIQPLTLTIQRGTSRSDVHLWAVPSCRIHIKVVDKPLVNAITNGPDILVTSGLLAFLQSPDELAWVLAHEIGHVAYDHNGRTRLQLTLDQFLAANAGVQPIGIARIEFERQADRFAASLVVKAGFDLRKAREVLERMQKVETASPASGFAKTHPSSKERIEALDEMIPELERQRALGNVPLLP